MDFKSYGLTAEQLEKMQADYNAEVEKIKADAVKPFADYDSLKETLLKNANDIKDYEKNIKSLTKDKEIFEKKYNEALIDNAINQAFYNENIKHADLFASKVDKTLIRRDENGNLIGLQEQMNNIKEKYGDMWQAKENHLVGSTPQHSQTPTPQPKEPNLENMSIKERVKAWGQMINSNDRRY